jgi:hypothetical protein
MDQTYTFTRTDLHKLLADAINLAAEYRDQHGQDEERAAASAIGECFEGLDALAEIAHDDYLDALAEDAMGTYNGRTA